MADRYQSRPFRADDDYDRAHNETPQQGESDPLAELARLIGQTDPFANIGREVRPPQAHAPSQDDLDDQTPPDVEPAPSRPSWMQRVTQRAPQPTYRDPVPAEPQYTAEPYEAAQDHGYAPQDHLPQAYAPHTDAQYEEPSDPARYDDALYGAADDGSDPRYAQHPGGYPDQGYDPEQGYDEAGDQIRRPRRGGMTTVVAVVALAIVGTVGAYAYRNYTGSPRNGEAPIIKADTTPNKIVPPTQAADASGKLIQDRIATGPGSERIVSREEQPVDVNTAKAGPRVVFPPLTQNPNPASATPPVMPANRPAGNGPASGNVGGDEPRKVRTLTIRPDQADVAPAVPAKPPAAAAPALVRAAVPANPAAVPAANAPMSLSPQAAAPSRMASNNPTPAAVAAGGYVVQISSQRSEADAQASYRALQGKFPSVLGSRPPLIKRADLGEKGIYYRAMVGPFGTPDEASQFCGSLKTAGGQCVVQRN
jgi:sporulation related protein